MHRYFLFNRKQTARICSVPATGCADDELFSCLETLPEKCKEVINLYYFENQSIAEIKATIGMSESTVRNRLNYGLYLLKTQMAKKPKNPV